MAQTPLVTVVITAYNHEHTIERAINSVLAQKTDFPFEIRIAEDSSQDNTRALLLRYAARWPQIIRIDPRPRSVGLSRNWYEALTSAKGQYVCLLKGDDWWLSEYKLQKQVDYLRKHPGCFAVGHRVRLIDSAGNVCGTLPDRRFLAGSGFLNAQQFLRGRIYSCTTCLVRNIFDPEDQKLREYMTANRNAAAFTLCMLYLDKGPIYLIDEELSARHVSSHLNTDLGSVLCGEIRRYRDFVEVVQSSRRYFNNAYNFDRCLLAGTAYPFTDRLLHGGLAPFCKEMHALPLRVRLCFPLFLIVHLLGRIPARIRRRKKHE